MGLKNPENPYRNLQLEISTEVQCAYINTCDGGDKREKIKYLPFIVPVHE